MKILFVTTCYPSDKLPQYCIFLEQQALSLQKKGHMVDVLHIDDNVDGELGVPLQHGINVFRKSQTSKKTKLDILFPRRLNKVDEDSIRSILETGYDVVSLHMSDLRLLRSLSMQCRRLDIPLVQHFHGLGIWHYYDDLHPLITSYTTILKKHIYSNLSAMIGVSGKVQEIFKNEVKVVPSYVVYNGVDVERFPMREKIEYFENGTVEILCVSNLIPIKGQKYLIEAAAELRKMGKNIRITFAGRGPDEKMLRNLANQLQVPVCFTGYILYDDISALMRQHDLFIMPSFYEALGCVYLEAMSAGMLTVGVKGQGIDEIICDGENGYLVEPRSIESIVAVIRHVLSLEQEELRKVAVRARETSMRFTWDESAKMLEAVYQQVIVGKGRE